LEFLDKVQELDENDTNSARVGSKSQPTRICKDVRHLSLVWFTHLRRLQLQNLIRTPARALILLFSFTQHCNLQQSVLKLTPGRCSTQFCPRNSSFTVRVKIRPKTRTPYVCEQTNITRTLFIYDEMTS